MSKETGRSNYWLKLVKELGDISTKRGCPVMSSGGDMDEIDFLSMRLKKMRELEFAALIEKRR